MASRKDTVLLQLLAIAVILLAATWPSVQQYLAVLFPFANIAIPAGAFVLLYKGLTFAYERHLWTIIHRDVSLAGLWIYGLHNVSAGSYVYGVFEISHSIDRLEFSKGESWYAGGPATQTNQNTQWYAPNIMREENRLWVIFHSYGRSRRPEGVVTNRYYGVAELVPEGTPPTRLKGNYHDLDQRRGQYGQVLAERVPTTSRSDAIELARQRFGESLAPKW